MHMVQSLGPGGLERLVERTSLGMDRDRFSIEVCCFDRLGNLNQELRDNGIVVTLVQRDQTKYDKFFPLRLARFIRQRKPDILQLHTGTFFPGAIGGWLAGVPAKLYTEHGRTMSESRFRLKTDYLAGRVIDKIIAVSAELEKYLCDVVKLPGSKTITVLNGVNTERFCPGKGSHRLKLELGLKPDCRVIGTIARLDEIKDQRNMIKAFELVLRKIPNSALIIAGSGPQSEPLQKQISDSNLQDAVFMTGERTDVPELLRLFDVFVLSSLSEGTSISLLEAMATGIPPVVTNVGGNPAVVTHDKNGLITEPGEPQQLASAIIELLLNEAKRTRLADQAIKRVQESFCLRRMIDDYTELYCELLKRRQEYSWLADR
jgi:glycosyltransferase involved in cell wall biosynthesis